jgi:hypothetical protein
MRNGDFSRHLDSKGYSLFSWLPITGIKDMRYQQFAIVAKLD